MPQDLKKAQTYGGKRISFENDEINQIKNFGPPGLYHDTLSLHAVLYKPHVL